MAELKNGKRGLVPNNYIEEVEGMSVCTLVLHTLLN